MDIGHLHSVFWAIFALVWIFGWLQTKQTKELAPLSSRLTYAIPVVIGSYLIFNDRTVLSPLQSLTVPKGFAIQVAALIMTAAGLGFAIWARFCIGQNWSSTVSVKVGHELVRTGPYRWVRHPIYSGILLALLGTALHRARMQDLLAVPLFGLGFWIKMTMEEQFMRRTFGEEYLEYARMTGALVPKLRF